MVGGRSYPSYLKAFESGELTLKVFAARSRLSYCNLCPNHCGVNRINGEEGVCQTGPFPSVVSDFAHKGEEACIRGRNGSGTIFFASCNLRCVFCQNYDISRLSSGDPISPSTLAAKMLKLQHQGCHNINLVTPSHVVPQFLEALEFAIPMGLNIPIVYNTSSYDEVQTLKLLDGIVDIYMADLKFVDRSVAEKYSRAGNYPEIAKQAIREMHRQVGDLQFDQSGVARKGLLIRHLVLPNGLAGTSKAMRFLVEEVSPETYVNLMSQYHPAGRAQEFSMISRCITAQEFLSALEDARKAGIRRFDRLDMPFRFG